MDETRTDSIQTRAAEPEDAENIARLVNAAFRPERFFVDGDRTNPEKVRVLLQKGKFLLVEEAGALVGCVYVELHGERGYFGLLAVDPALQRSGLGSRMVAAAEEYCRAANCHFMDLTIVNLRAELPPFYHRLGYTESGILPFPSDQHPNQPCHLVKMSKPLVWHKNIAVPWQSTDSRVGRLPRSILSLTYPCRRNNAVDVEIRSGRNVYVSVGYGWYRKFRGRTRLIDAAFALPGVVQ
jgi:ribosomal protein S18 acetylase RimI-like enzyme